MKRLFYCSAKYDNDTLESYNTIIVKRYNNQIYFRNYHSNTTRMHVRRYIEKLRNLGDNTFANQVDILYKYTMSKGLFKDAYALVAEVKDNQLINIHPVNCGTLLFEYKLKHGGTMDNE